MPKARSFHLACEFTRLFSFKHLNLVFFNYYLLL